MKPRSLVFIACAAISSCKPSMKDSALKDTVGESSDLASILEMMSERLIEADGLAFTLEADHDSGMAIAATELGTALPDDPKAKVPPRSMRNNSESDTAFALQGDAPVDPIPRKLVPTEMAARIQDFETAIAESRRRTSALTQTINDYAATVSTYRSKADKDATILKSMEVNLDFQKQTLSALEASNVSLASLYDKAVASITAQNLRLASFEGDLSSLKDTVKKWDEKMTTTPVHRPEESRPDITALAARPPEGDGVDFQDSAFFHHPRVESAFTRIDTFGVTGSVGFQAKFIGAQAAVHYEIRYGVETIVAAGAGVPSENPEDTASASIIRPLFTAAGVTNRETSSLCIVFATHIVNPSTQLGVGLGPISATAMASRLDQSDSRQISQIFKNDKGMSFGAIKKRCDQYYEKVMREAPPAGDLTQIRPEYVHKATQCYSDIDCKDDLDGKIPPVQNYMISECRHKAADKKGLCETRVVEGDTSRPGNACHPTTYDYGFVWPCSKGLVCTGYEQGYFSNTPGICAYEPDAQISDESLNGLGKIMLRNWSRGLQHVGLSQDRIKHVGALSVSQMTPQAIAGACGAKGLAEADGWRLPSVRELWAIGVYDRERIRNRELKRLVQRGGFFSASDWYYADAAFQGIIWSRDSFVYLKERQGTVPVELGDGSSVSKLTPKMQSGDLYCIKGGSGRPEADLDD